jgi:hypothetical protein
MGGGCANKEDGQKPTGGHCCGVFTGAIAGLWNACTIPVGLVFGIIVTFVAVADTSSSAQVLAAGFTISNGRGVMPPEQAPHGHRSMSFVTGTVFSLSSNSK